MGLQIKTFQPVPASLRKSSGCLNLNLWIASLKFAQSRSGLTACCLQSEFMLASLMGCVRLVSESIPKIFQHCGQLILPFGQEVSVEIYIFYNRNYGRVLVRRNLPCLERVIPLQFIGMYMCSFGKT